MAEATRPQSAAEILVAMAALPPTIDALQEFCRTQIAGQAPLTEPVDDQSLDGEARLDSL